MPTRNISLTEHFDHFIDDQIKAGQFHDANEAIGAGLRLLEQQTREDAEKDREPQEIDARWARLACSRGVYRT